MKKTDGEGGITAYAYHPSGDLRQTVSPVGDVERWERDDAGRPLAYIAADGQRAKRVLSPAGRVLCVSDNTGSTVRFRWGPHGALAANVDPLGFETRYSWDHHGNRVGRHLPGGADWHFDYDPLGRMTGFTDPSAHRWDITWGLHGSESGYRDPLGHGVESHLDPTGRTVTSRTSGGRDRELTMDEAGRMIAGSADRGGTSCALERDVFGRITRLWLDGRELGRWTYTSAGRIATLSRSDGALWRWSYDRCGRPVRVEAPTGTQRVTHDPVGRVVGPHWGRRGRPLYLTWDGGGRLAETTTAGDLHRVPLGRCRAVGRPAAGFPTADPLRLRPERTAGRGDRPDREPNRPRLQ